MTRNDTSAAKGVTTIAGWIYLASVFAFILAPAAVLVLYSFQADRVLVVPIRSYSFRWYFAIVENPDLAAGFRNSVLVGSIVSVMATTLGLATAYLICRVKVRALQGYLAIIMMPALIPLLLSGLASLMYFQRVRLDGTLWSIVIAHTCYCSPFAAALLRLQYKRLNIEIELAALNLGATPLQALMSVVVPQLRPAIIASLLLTFLLSWDEFVIAWFVGGFQKTLPVVIYGMLGSAVSPLLNAVGTVAMLVSLVVLGGVIIAERGSKR